MNILYALEGENTEQARSVKLFPFFLIHFLIQNRKSLKPHVH